MTEKREQAIGIFDSGFGGLTVMNQIQKILPNENLIYLGDTARLPYGNKSAETILKYAIENATFLIEKKIKALVIACNTATAFALETLQGIFKIPILGVIEPAIEEAVKITKSNHIAVLGTHGTISSKVYEKFIKKIIPQAVFHGQECPLLVHLVEENMIDHPATELILKDYLNFLKNSSFDTIILGCTHYPLLENLIKKIVGENLSLINSAKLCADKLHDKLAKNNSLNLQQESGSKQFYTSDDPKKFAEVGKFFLNAPLIQVEKYNLGF